MMEKDASDADVINSGTGDRNGVQVIARAAAILRAIEAEPDGLSLGELAKRLDLARSTVQRLVGALADEQLVMTGGPRGGVTLGSALVRLAAAANIETDRIVRPFLQSLSRDVSETVDLSTLRGRTAIFVDQVPGTSRLIAISAVGDAFPLHCSANGKALLACLPPDRVRTLVEGRMTPMTANTITDFSKLQAEIETVRATQLSLDLEEHSLGICAIGTSFVDPLGREFALSVPVPATRFAAKRAAIADALLSVRGEIMRKMPHAR